MSVFEIITKEEFDERTEYDDTPRASGSSSGSTDEGAHQGSVTGSTPGRPAGTIWCEFCKGHYNEYHFGDIDEEGGE